MKLETLEGSFSAVSKPNFASRDADRAFAWRALRKWLTALSRFARICAASARQSLSPILLGVRRAPEEAKKAASVASSEIVCPSPLSAAPSRFLKQLASSNYPIHPDVSLSSYL